MCETPLRAKCAKFWLREKACFHWLHYFLYCFNTSLYLNILRVVPGLPMLQGERIIIVFILLFLSFHSFTTNGDGSPVSSKSHYTKTGRRPPPPPPQTPQPQ